MKILLTRNPLQNQQLCQEILGRKLLGQSGVGIEDIVSLPLLKAEPLTTNEQAKQTILALDRFDDIFFISKNAAGFGLRILEQYWPQWPLSLRWFAVGAGTASALQSANVNVLYPQQASSAGLLRMGSLKNVAGRKCLIVRGEGGRETLREGLEARGAEVTYLEIYRRVTIDYGPKDLPQDADTVALIYSGEALSHLKQLGDAKVLQYQIIVPSERLQIMANDLGFAKVVLANSQEDRAMLKVLQQTQRHMS